MTMLRTTLSLCAIAATAVAQNDYALDKSTAGTIGSTLTMAVRSAPANALLLVMPSFTAGPTALAAFDPTDARSVQVGTDLIGTWFTLFTSATGTATILAAIPVNNALAGLVLHWQTLTAPGTTHLVDRIGNDVVTQLGIANRSAPTAAALGGARAFATVSANPLFNSGQGDAVIAGGGAGTLTAATGLASSEIWDFRHLARRAGPNLTSARALHLAVPLTNGRVLMIGGVDAVGTVLASSELYDPVTNTFTPTGSMAAPRVMHAACRMPNGRVLVAGGTSSLVDTATAIASVLDSCEVYDPTTGAWSGAAPLGGRRLGPALTTTANNRVMVSGGVQVSFILGVPFAASSTTAVQFYNTGTNTWSAGPAMPAGRAGHHYNQVTLADGRVLMSGGINVPSLLGATNAAPIANADLYNPTANSWTSGSMPNARSLHSATALPNGNVVVCGGAQGTLTAPSSIDRVDLFDLASGTWSSLPPMSIPRSGHVAWLQPDGLLVLIGGQGAVTTTTSIEVMHF